MTIISTEQQTKNWMKFWRGGGTQKKEQDLENEVVEEGSRQGRDRWREKIQDGEMR